MRTGEPASATIEGFTFRRNHPHARSPVLPITGAGGRFIGNVVKQIDGIHADDGSVEAVGNTFLEVDDHALQAAHSDVVFGRNLVLGGASLSAMSVTARDRPDASVEIADNRVHLARDKAMWLSGLDSAVVRNNMFTMNEEGVTILGVAPLVTSNVFALNDGVIDFQGTNGGRFVNNTVYAAESNNERRGQLLGRRPRTRRVVRQVRRRLPRGWQRHGFGRRRSGD